MILNKDKDRTNDISAELSVVLGSADIKIYQLLKLGRGAVVELDRDINATVDIYANSVLIGFGDVVITENDNIGISVTELTKRNQ